MPSRRTILKSIGLVGLGSALALRRGIDLAHAQADIPPANFVRWSDQPLLRVTNLWQHVRGEPTTESDIVHTLVENDVVRVRRVIEGQWTYVNNNLWLETRFGYINAAFVQPMYYHLPQPPRSDLGGGRWAEVIVPTSEAYYQPDPSKKDKFAGLIYYGCVLNVRELVRGADGNSWYKVKEVYQRMYIRATHVRLIPAADLTPITPEIAPKDKHIVLFTDQQLAVAYEYGQPVWSHPMSSGINDEDTPVGEYYVFDKRAGTRMTSGTASADPGHYDLPGVAYVSYFTGKGVGLHGTYWHNDYGRKRSHGCVNFPNEAARWLWRWTDPHPPDVNALYYKPSWTTDGTKIVVTRG